MLWSFVLWCMINMASAESERSVKVLAHHKATCRYAGNQERKCMFLTSLCPDHCNHANKWAIFTVTEYLHYDKPGQYGDEKQTQFALQLRPIETRVEHAPNTFQLVETLNVGDPVEIEWLHEYVSDQGANYPIRRVIAIKKL